MTDRDVSACIFCAVVAGDAPAHVVLRSPGTMAFLDRRPLFHGHLLVVPERHMVTLADLRAEEVGPFFAVVQRVARALPEALGAEGTFVANNNVVSQSVAHLHVHVVPRRKGDGLRGFFWPRLKYADEAEMASIAARIARSLNVTE